MTASTHAGRVVVDGVGLDVSALDLDLDVGRVPFASATINAAMPALEMLDRFDPRELRRVHVSMRQNFGSSETLAAISADYAGMTIDDMGALSGSLNENTSMEDGTIGWEGIEGTTIVQSDDEARTGIFSLEAIPPVPDPINLLTDSQAKCSSTTGWMAVSGCTISVTAAQAAEGFTSIGITKVTTSLFASVEIPEEDRVSVQAGQQYTAIAEFRAATNPRECQIGVGFFDANGDQIGSWAVAFENDSTSGWNQIHRTVTAPSGAVTASIQLLISQFGGIPDGEVHYFDKVGISEGTDTMWTDPPPSFINADFVSDPVPVSHGVLFLCRAWARLTGSADTRAVVLNVQYLDAAEAVVDEDGFGATLIEPADGWVPVVGTGAVPDNPDIVSARIILNASVGWADQRIFYDDVIIRYARTSIRSLSAEYGRPYNAYGFRPSTDVRAALWLRNRSIDHGAGTLTLEASSGDAILLDYALVSTATMTPTGPTVRDAVNMVLGHVLSTALQPSSSGSEIVEADALPWQPGETAWSYLQTITGSAGLRLWCDEVGLFHLDDPEAATRQGQVNLTTDNATVLTDGVSRDDGDWADAAVVTYEWTDTEGAQQTQHDVAGMSGTRTLTLRVDRPYPGAGLAAHMLRKAEAMGRVLALGAVADYDVRPMHAAAITIPGVELQAGQIASVAWSQPGDAMTVSTRGLVTIGEFAWLFLPSGLVTWDNTPAGTSWLDDVWEGA